MNRKKLFILLILIANGIITNAQTKNIPTDTLTKKLAGIWEYEGQRSSNQYEKGFQKGRPATYKIYSANMTFANFSWTKPHSIITSKGNWKVKSDSVLIETVKGSGNKDLIGKNNKLIFRIKDNKYLYIKWFLKERNGMPINIWLEELWRRVDLLQKININEDTGA